MVFKGRIPDVNKGDIKYGNLLSFFHTANGNLLIKRKGKTEFASVFDGFMAYVS